MDIVTSLADADHLTELRSHRPVAVEQTQLAYDLLLNPVDESVMDRRERWAVAAFVAILHSDEAAARHYGAGLSQIAPELSVPVQTLAKAGAATGPYGSYPAGPLSVEDLPGDDLIINAATTGALGERLAAALRHAHRLVLHPRDADPGWIVDLQVKGWNRPGIVTLSQLISFLAYQLRLVAGLRAIKEAAHDRP